MNYENWVEVIQNQCKQNGTMREGFIPVVKTLALILERRDLVYEQFIEEGEHILVDRKSDRGSVNKAKNPLYVAWHELNTLALRYWRELGCTAKGLSSIQRDEAGSINDLIEESRAIDIAFNEEVLKLRELVELYGTNPAVDEGIQEIIKRNKETLKKF